MSYLDKLKSSFLLQAQNKKGSKLIDSIKTILKDADESKIYHIASIGALMAKVILNDLKVDPGEINFIKDYFNEYFEIGPLETDQCIDLLLKHARDLSGRDDHLYTQYLNELLDEHKKYKVLELLFSLSASDEMVDNFESETIRNISKALHLNSNHFLSARAKVIEKLGALKDS